MNVLVVGGAGYLGGAVTDLLMEQNIPCRVYDSLLYEEDYRKPVAFIRGDVRDVERLKNHLRWAHAVIWLAAIVGDGACAIDPDTTREINAEAVRWLRDNYNGRVIFMSTCSVYGAAHDAILDEQSPTNPLSVYAETKLQAESYLTDTDAVIFRLGTLFGVSDAFSRIRTDLVVNTMTLRAHVDGTINVFGGGQFRPLLHVRDAARAAVAAIVPTFTGTYNLHRQNVRIVDLAHQIRCHYPDIDIQQTDILFEDARNYRVNSDRVREVMDWMPTHTIDCGIDQIRQLLAEGRLSDVRNQRYSNEAYLRGLAQ